MPPHVIVVGAGPAGALLALLLARRSHSVTLLERTRDFAREFRGEVLMPSGLEALDQTGLWAEVDALPHVPLRAVEFYLKGVRRLRQELPVEAFGRHRPTWMSQPELLEMLVAQAARYPRFRIERGAAVRGLCERDGRVRGVHVLWADGSESDLMADLVVGTDGRSSTVRRRAGLPERSDRVLHSTVSDRALSWSRPGVIVLGDAAHTMSPVGAQGINVALRDAVEAANELVPVLDSGADAGALGAACRRVEALRLPEVRTIQRLQALPPRVLFRKTWWARLVLELVPRLLGSDIARARMGTAFRRFAFGVTEVRLRV